MLRLKDTTQVWNKSTLLPNYSLYWFVYTKCLSLFGESNRHRGHTDCPNTAPAFAMDNLTGSRTSVEQDCKPSKRQLYKLCDFEFVLYLDFFSTNVGFTTLPILLPVHSACSWTWAYNHLVGLWKPHQTSMASVKRRLLSPKVLSTNL